MVKVGLRLHRMRLPYKWKETNGSELLMGSIIFLEHDKV